MRFRWYFRRAIVAWRQFRDVDPAEFDKIQNLILVLGREITDTDNRKEINAFSESSHYSELRPMLLAHARQLGLIGVSDKEMQMWIRIILFEEINKEHPKG
jgi:hypothetical protein